MPQAVRGWLWILVCATALRAADPPKPELPAAVRPIITAARSAAPELLADTIVRLVEGGQIPSRELQVDLLSEAFGAATRASQPVKLAAIPGTPGSARAAYVSRAGELNLDALSLGARVLKALVTVDRAKARALFQGVLHPALAARNCEDPLVADASAYYEIAGLIAQSAFSEQEKKDHQHAQFMLAALAGAQSPNELGAFARALESVSWTPEEWELLISGLAEKFGAIRADYRPFALSAPVLLPELDFLTKIAQGYGLDQDTIRKQFRQYLVTQMTGARCSENLDDAETAVKWFNADFRRDLKPISEEEMQPSKRGGGIKTGDYFRSSEATQMEEEFRQLRMASLGVAGKGAPAVDTGALLASILRDFATWQPEGSALDVFHQRATVLFGLFHQMNGAEREKLRASCIAFLESSAVEQQNYPEWLIEVKTLVDSADTDRMELLQAFRASGDPGLSLFTIFPH